MVLGDPCICIRQISTSESLTASIDPSFCRAHTSLIIPAPASIACFITIGLDVSTETAISNFDFIALTIGITRDNSSSSATSGAPGRVDSPPISIISAP